jgi:hypothetical protein
MVEPIESPVQSTDASIEPAQLRQNLSEKIDGIDWTVFATTVIVALRVRSCA